ncbi:MAG: globin [Capsulimonadaceae bacterium]
MEDRTTLIFDRLGTAKPLHDLAEAFYRGIETDPVLRPMYPQNLASSRNRLELFLIQRFGGPGTYSEMRGHPRLRMRHAPFLIGVRERDAWMRHMLAALDSVPELQPFRPDLDRYFQESADFLINKPD